MTPQQRTRDYLTAQGYLVGTVESKKSFPDRKKGPCRSCGHQPLISVSVDLFNVFDVIALHPNGLLPVIFVQTTSRANHSTRRNKILSSMEAKLVLLSGCGILLQSWAKTDGRWQPKDEWITTEDYKSALHYPSDVPGLLEIKRRAKKPDLPAGSTLPLETEELEEPLPPGRAYRRMSVVDKDLPF